MYIIIIHEDVGKTVLCNSWTYLDVNDYLPDQSDKWKRIINVKIIMVWNTIKIINRLNNYAVSWRGEYTEI